MLPVSCRKLEKCLLDFLQDQPSLGQLFENCPISVKGVTQDIFIS